MYPRSPRGRPMPRKLRRRIVRQIETALANIDAALAGKSFRNEDEAHASFAIVRMAPRLFRIASSDEEAQSKQSLYHPRWTEAEANDLLERLEVAEGGETREKCAEIWAEKFREYGPEAGEYQTLAEAQEYGRKVWDRIQAQPEFIPHAELRSKGGAS